MKKPRIFLALASLILATAAVIATRANSNFVTYAYWTTFHIIGTCHNGAPICVGGIKKCTIVISSSGSAENATVYTSRHDTCINILYGKF